MSCGKIKNIDKPLVLVITMRKVHDLSQKQIQQLLETPGCTKDDELSERYSGLLDVYRLANGGALLHIPGTRRGVLYE